jgi:plasmid stabilization system protein ParE
MPYAIVIMPRARRLIAEARDWWRVNCTSAPTLLGEELDRAFNRLAENPHLGASWPRREGVRRLVLARVGFLVLYRVHARAERIELLAVWHGARGRPPPGL